MAVFDAIQGQSSVPLEWRIRGMRNSRWTQIYWDFDENGIFSYIRFVPDFMNLEETGFSHGISISGNHFSTSEEANKTADVYDKFFDAMAAELIDTSNFCN